MTSSWQMTAVPPKPPSVQLSRQGDLQGERDRVTPGEAPSHIGSGQYRRSRI